MNPRFATFRQVLGLASAQKWLNAIRQALLPPQVPPSAAVSETAEETQQAQQIAFEFSQLYQFNQQEELGCGQFGTVYGGVHRRCERVSCPLTSRSVILYQSPIEFMFDF